MVEALCRVCVGKVDACGVGWGGVGGGGGGGGKVSVCRKECHVHIVMFSSRLSAIPRDVSI